MKLSFLGAARQVTGSMYLLELDDYRILIDCGSDMERSAPREATSNGQTTPPTLPQSGFFSF
jgi:metallo-beta-lactamase family protein